MRLWRKENINYSSEIVSVENFKAIFFQINFEFLNESSDCGWNITKNAEKGKL